MTIQMKMTMKFRKRKKKNLNRKKKLMSGLQKKDRLKMI